MPTDQKIQPASDEEIEKIRKVRQVNILERLSLIARIEADRARIKRCHAIIQSFVAITDPDASPQLDAAMELSGEFCPGECTHECEERAEADRARIRELAESREVWRIACHAAETQHATSREQIRAKDEKIARLELRLNSKPESER